MLPSLFLPRTAWFPPLNNKQAVHLGLLGARNSENKSIHTIIFAYLFNFVQLGPSLMKKLVYTPTTTYYPQNTTHHQL